LETIHLQIGIMLLTNISSIIPLMILLDWFHHGSMQHSSLHHHGPSLHHQVSRVSIQRYRVCVCVCVRVCMYPIHWPLSWNAKLLSLLVGIITLFFYMYLGLSLYSTSIMMNARKKNQRKKNHSSPHCFSSPKMEFWR
jgi:hypothetical protein